MGLMDWMGEAADCLPETCCYFWKSSAASLAPWDCHCPETEQG